MPTFDLSTNVEKVPPEMLEELTKLTSRILGKDEKFICVYIKAGQMMSWGGDAKSPCAVVYLSSIGKLGGALNKSHTTEITNYLTKKIGVSPDRMYINFVDQVRSEISWNGQTFAEILK